MKKLILMLTILISLIGCINKEQYPLEDIEFNTKKYLVVFHGRLATTDSVSVKIDSIIPILKYKYLENKINTESINERLFPYEKDKEKDVF